MVNVEYPLNGRIKFPHMRREIETSLEALAQVEQQTQWLLEGGLDLCIHVLFDDTMVLPEPDWAIGDTLFEAEIDPLRVLGKILDSIIGDLGDSMPESYLTDPRWKQVVEAAGVALVVMNGNDIQAQG